MSEITVDKKYILNMKWIYTLIWERQKVLLCAPLSPKYRYVTIHKLF